MKVEPNIYYDERCTKYPYSVNIMREGQSFARKFDNLEAAQEARDDFIREHTKQPTTDPDVFIKQGIYILEFTVYREFENLEDAVEKAEILRKFMKIK